MSKEEIDYIQTLIDNVHNQFKSTVEVNRKIDKSSVEKVADGRIFSGEQALNLKLVDRLGNLNSAINYAVDQSGITGEPIILNYPEKKSPLSELLFSKLNLSFQIDSFRKVPSSSSFGLFYIVDIIH